MARGLRASGSMTDSTSGDSSAAFWLMPTVAISGSVKMLAATPRTLSGDDGVAERVPHGDAPLHGGDGREGQHAGAVAGGVDPADAGARDPVDLDVPGGAELDAGLLESHARGVGHRPDGEQGVRALDGAAVDERDDDPVGGALDRRGARLVQHLHAALAEDVLDDRGGVGVLAGQHAVARRHEHDLRAEAEVGLGELGAGDT